MPMLHLPDECPCCKLRVHHCKSCWDKHHNGVRDNDYIPPKYHGEQMFDLEHWIAGVPNHVPNYWLGNDRNIHSMRGGDSHDWEKAKKDIERRQDLGFMMLIMAYEDGIVPDKKRRYVEGSYGHDC